MIDYIHNVIVSLFLIEFVEHTDLSTDRIFDFGKEQTVCITDILVLHIASDNGLTHCLGLVAHGLRVGIVGGMFALGWQPLLLLAINIDQFVG